MTATQVWSTWSCTVAVTVQTARQLGAAGELVAALLDDVDGAVSRFRPGSQISRVNAAAGRLVPVTPLAFELVEVALLAARASHGAVDPTVGGALLDLGYDADIDTVRGTRRGEPTGRAPRGTWRDVVLDRTLHRIGVPVGMTLDLGATAKGWAADEAARRVHRRCGTPVLVELGGDLAACGQPDEPWRIDVCERRGEPGERIGLVRGGIATSSTCARAWTGLDGSPLHHVVDPSTGRCAQGPWRTATVWAASALAANVASTQALVRGQGAVDQLRAQGLAARLVATDGHLQHVGSWPVPRRAVAA